jgi:hypothetical protein
MKLSYLMNKSGHAGGAVPCAADEKARQSLCGLSFTHTLATSSPAFKIEIEIHHKDDDHTKVITKKYITNKAFLSYDCKLISASVRPRWLNNGLSQ